MKENLIKQIEKLIIEEMKQLCGDVKGINWEQVRLNNDSDLDWYEHEMDIFFHLDDESQKNYKFCYDYRFNRGLLLIENKERKPTNYKEIKIWGNWEDDNEG
ncbi:hypothetical protein [Neobacillus cucumis]|uniref:hypothetical protein n=1 Tax=Neobacillus cucumis TaxID=1740721 RepID=UPI001964F6BD|nr:hypothetical protein [Neobacillus cucumis]MBM7656219.1 hypothetical protein [Neobacillus cucumis]